MRLYPKGQIWGLFGLNTVPKDAKEVILTEGEYDAMAAYQVPILYIFNYNNNYIFIFPISGYWNSCYIFT